MFNTNIHEGLKGLFMSLYISAILGIRADPLQLVFQPTLLVSVGLLLLAAWLHLLVIHPVIFVLMKHVTIRPIYIDPSMIWGLEDGFFQTV